MKKIFIALFSIILSLYVFPQDTMHVPADYPTIQAGINAANNGDIVLVDEGTYYENVVIVNKPITLASNFFISGNTSYISNTIIDGSQPSSTDSASVIMIFNTFEPVTICGFTLTGGSGKKTIWPGGSFTIAGAGLYIEHSSVEIINNHIINNSIYSSGDILGGGIFWGANIFSGFTLKISGNLIAGNEISGLMTGGGGINISNYFIGGELNYLIEENTIENNTVTNIDVWKAMGGGIFLDFGLPTVGDQIIRNNIIRNNSVNCTHSFGGGLYFIIRDTLVTGEVDNDSGPYVYNNKIYENHSDYLGAGISVWRAYYKPGHPAEPLQSAGNYVPKPSFINNTIVDNTAQDGSGFFIMNHVPFLMNNIIRNNYPGNAEWGEIFLGDVPYWMEPNHYQGVMMFYNDIQEGWEDGDSAAGNIDYDPLFSDTLFNLLDSSICIGAGIDSIEISDTWYYAPLFDFDGDPRPNPPECMPDIGAQESPLCIPATTISIEPTELYFGEVEIDSSKTMTFTITNTGNLDLEVTNITSNEPAFTVDTTSVTIPPGGEQDLEVTFTPTEEILYNGIIEITSNAVGGPNSVSVTGNGIVSGINNELLNTLPDDFVLFQNYPNPFNPKTIIIFGLPEASEIKLTLFNSLGEEVANLFKGYLNAGYHQIEFSASSLPSGVYFYQLRADGYFETKKMILLK